MPAFRAIFNVLENPEKLTVKNNGGATTSFDVRGIYQRLGRREVFLECKARTVGSDLSEAYRAFLARSYLTSLLEEHRDDLFWFATNVPFATTIGTALVKPDYVSDQIIRYVADNPSYGDIKPDPDLVRRLSENLSVCIFTDSQLKRMDLLHYVRDGESLWDITMMLHGFKLPLALSDIYEPYAADMAQMNRLSDANLLFPGQPIRMRWFGVDI
jgi:hypothetical protein